MAIIVFAILIGICVYFGVYYKAEKVYATRSEEDMHDAFAKF